MPRIETMQRNPLMKEFGGTFFPQCGEVTFFVEYAFNVSVGDVHNLQIRHSHVC